MASSAIHNNAWYTDAWPSGDWVCLLPGQGVDTSEGPLPLPHGEDILQLRMIIDSENILRIAGIGHGSGLAWEWDGGQWLDHGPTHGNNAVIFRGDDLLVASDGTTYDTGSIGFRYIAADGTPVPSWKTYADVSKGLYEYTEYPDIVIGQGETGVVCRFPNEGFNRLIGPGDTTFVRVNRKGNKFSIAYVRQDTNQAINHWLTYDELRALAPYQSPTPSITPYRGPALIGLYDADLATPGNVEIRDLGERVQQPGRKALSTPQGPLGEAIGIYLANDGSSTTPWLLRLAEAESVARAHNLPLVVYLENVDPKTLPTGCVLAPHLMREANESVDKIWTRWAQQVADVAPLGPVLPVVGVENRGYLSGREVSEIIQLARKLLDLPDVVGFLGFAWHRADRGLDLNIEAVNLMNQLMVGISGLPKLPRLAALPEEIEEMANVAYGDVMKGFNLGELLPHPDAGYVKVLKPNGRILCVGPDGNVEDRPADAAGPWERFKKTKTALIAEREGGHIYIIPLVE